MPVSRGTTTGAPRTFSRAKLTLNGRPKSAWKKNNVNCKFRAILTNPKYRQYIVVRSPFHPWHLLHRWPLRLLRSKQIQSPLIGQFLYRTLSLLDIEIQKFMKFHFSEEIVGTYMYVTKRNKKWESWQSTVSRKTISLPNCWKDLVASLLNNVVLNH